MNRKLKVLWKFLCDNNVPNIVTFKGKNIERIELRDRHNVDHLDFMHKGLRQIGL